jgi:hypothetical protein
MLPPSPSQAETKENNDSLDCTVGIRCCNRVPDEVDLQDVVCAPVEGNDIRQEDQRTESKEALEQPNKGHQATQQVAREEVLLQEISGEDQTRHPTVSSSLTAQQPTAPGIAPCRALVNSPWDAFDTWYWYFPIVLVSILVGMVWSRLPYWLILTVFGVVCVVPMNVGYYVGWYGNQQFYLRYPLMYIYILWSTAWPWFCVYTMLWASTKEVTTRMFYIYVVSQMLYDLTADTVLSLAFGQAVFSRLMFSSQVTKHLIQYFVFGITPWGWIYVVTIVGFNIHNILQLCGVYSKLLRSLWSSILAVSCCSCCVCSSTTVITSNGFHIETEPAKCLALLRWKSRVLMYMQDLLSEALGLLSFFILVAYPLSTRYVSKSLVEHLPERISFLLVAKGLTWLIARPILKRLYPHIITINCAVQLNNSTLTSTLRQLKTEVTIQERHWIQQVLHREHQELFTHLENGLHWSWDTFLSSAILHRHSSYYIATSLFVLCTLTIPWWNPTAPLAVL